MKKFKKLVIFAIILSFMFNILWVSKTYAASFDEINTSEVFLKQEGSTTCTLCAATMLLRRSSLLLGNNNWREITENKVKSTAWISGAGLRYSFTYDGISIGHGTLPTGSANKEILINLLRQHPEGIVIYYGPGTKQHAVLLTDYTDGVFYCADPYGGKPSGRIPLTSALYVTVSNVSAYWYVTNPDIPDPITYTQPPSNAKVELSSYLFAVGEYPQFRVSADNAAWYFLGIDNENGRIDTPSLGSSTSYSRTFSNAGNYSCYVSAGNPLGACDSERVNFRVYDSKPSNLTITTERQRYYVGEEVSIKLKAKDGLGFYISVFKDDQLYCNGGADYVNQSYTYKNIFNEPGKYTAYYTTWNNFGSEDSKWISFEVVNKAPTYANLKTTKSEYSVNENVKLIPESDYATHYFIKLLDKNNNDLGCTLTAGETINKKYSVGEYSAYMSAANGGGTVDSKWIWFSVYNTAPKDVELKLEKEIYEKGTEISFKPTGKYIEKYIVIVEKDGKVIETSSQLVKDKTFKKVFNDAGQYSAYATGYNEFGETVSNAVTFTIKDDSEIEQPDVPEIGDNAFLLSVSAPSTVNPGDTLTYKCTLDNIQDASGIAAINLDSFTYNPEQLTFIEDSIKFSNGLANWEIDGTCYQEGIIRVIANEKDGIGIAESGKVVFEISFKVNEKMEQGTVITSGVEEVTGTNGDLDEVSGIGNQVNTKVNKNKMELTENSFYQFDGERLVKYVSDQTSVKNFLDNFKPAILRTVDASGTVKDDTKIVGTGDKVQLMSGDNVIEEKDICIFGDVSGDGKVNGTDYLRIRRNYLGTYDLQGVYKEAADVNEDEKINGTDYLRVRRHYLGTYNLYQK